LTKYEFPGDKVPVIKGSALKALEGDPEHEKAIEDLMKAVDEFIPEPKRDLDKPFLMAVEDVFSITGRGTVATGRVERGKIAVGDEVEIVGIKDTQKTVTTGLEMFRKTLEESVAGDNVGALLRGIDKDKIERGQVLAKPGSIKPHKKFKGQVYVLNKEEGGRHTPFFKGYRPQFYFRTTDVTGSIELPAGTETLSSGPTSTISLPRMTIVVWGTARPFLTSMTVVLVMAQVGTFASGSIGGSGCWHPSNPMSRSTGSRPK